MPYKDDETRCLHNKSEVRATVDVFLACHIRETYFQLLRGQYQERKSKGDVFATKAGSSTASQAPKPRSQKLHADSLKATKRLFYWKSKARHKVASEQ